MLVPCTKLSHLNVEKSRTILFHEPHEPIRMNRLLQKIWWASHQAQASHKLPNFQQKGNQSTRQRVMYLIRLFSDLPNLYMILLENLEAHGYNPHPL